MDKWDPRKDDFNDQKFNSYVKGPGKNLPTNRVKGDKYVQLFITGIPNEITQDGLNNLFSRAGKVISSRKMQSKKEGAGDTYGFVTMANAIDAERAIREFHNFRIERFTLRVQVSRNEADNRRRNFQSDLTLNFMGDAAFNDDGFDADANTPEDMTPTGSTNLNGSTMNGFGAVPAPTGAGRGQMLAELSSASGVALGTAGNTTLQSPGQLSVNVGESGVGRGITLDPSNTPMPTPVPMSGRKQPLLDYNTDHIGRGGSNKSQRGGRCYTRGGYGRGYQDSYYDNQSQGGGYRGRGGGGGGHRGGRGGYMEQYGGGPGEGYGRGMPYPPQQHPMMYSMPMMDPYTYGMMAAGAAASTQHLLQPAYPAMMGPTGAAGPQYQPNTSVSEKRNVNRNKEELTYECSVCGSVGRLRCSVCKEPYCSPDCQKRDWPEHKKVCKVISSEKELSAEFSNTFDVSVGDELIPKVKELMEKAVGGSIEISRKPPKPSQSQSARGGEPKSGHVSEAEGDTKPRAGDRGSTDERRNNNNSGAGGDRKKSYSGDSQDGGSGGAKKFANADGGGAKKAQGSCFNCGSTDHYRQDCKEPIGINQQCYNCKQTGHLSRDCPNDRNDKNCFKCGGKGHLSKDCQNKEENRSSDKKCYNCQKTGHFSRECPEKSENRRDNRPPSTPHGKKEMTNGDHLSTSRPFNPAPTTLSTPVTAQTRKPTASPPPKKSLATEALPVNEEVQVVVTEVVDPSNIYVQVLNEEKVLLLSKIMTEMAEKYESSKSDVSSAMVGEIYACQYSEDRAWYRAQVVRRDERARVTVAYVDFGNQERTEQGSLRQLEPPMMKLPAQAVLCSLEDLQPVSGTEWKFAKADLEKYITPNMAYKITCNKALDGPTGKCHDVVMTNGAGENVAQSLVSAGFARNSPTPSPAGSPQVPVSDGPPMVRDLARVQTGLVEGQKIPVFITDAATPLRFTVQVLTDSNIQAYQEFNLAFQQLYNTQEDIYNPTAIGELVASRFSGDEDWYRGEVTSISGDTANIRFIDFGNSETVKKFVIRRALPMTLNVPVQAVYCCMHGVDEPTGGLWPEDALKFLHNMLMQPMVATVVEFQDKRASLELFQDTVGSVNNKVKEIIRKVLPAKSTSQPASAETKPSSAPSKTPTKPTDVASSASSAKQAAASVNASTERGKVSKAASLPLDGTKVEVIVGMITSLKSFYLLLADSVTQQKYVKLQQDLNVHYQTAVPYSPTPYDALVGEVVAYCNMEPEPVRWERALITEKLEGGVYNAFHIDSGNSSKRVDGLSVKRLDAQFCALPSRAIPCRLAGCEALDHTKQLEKLGEALKRPTLARAVNFMNNVYSVEIYKPDNTNLLKWLVASTEPSQPVATAAATSTPDNTSNSKPHTVASTACSAATQGVNQHVQIKESSLPTDGSQALGVVVFIESLSSFCVQLFTEDLRDTLARLNTLNQVCEKDTTVYTPSIGEHVSAMFTTDSEWYRAVVRGQTKAGYEVYFIDFGNDDVVPETAIRKHCLALDGIPAMAVRCRLAGLTGEEDIELQKEFNMMLNQRVMVQVKGKLEDRYSVELFLTNDEATSVNKVLKLDPAFVPAATTCQLPATPSSPAVPTQSAVSAPSPVVPVQESGPPTSTPTPEVPSSTAHTSSVLRDIARERLPVGQPLAAAPMLINSVNDFYVQSADETKQRHLLEILLKLQEVYKDSTSQYSPRQREFVAVLFNDGADELWYRAEVLSVEQSGQCSLFLIDYGNVITLQGNLIRELQPSLFTYPCLAHKCSLAGFDIVSEVVTNKFSEMTLNKEVTITVKAFENGTYTVDLVHEGKNITEHLLPLLGTASASSSSSSSSSTAAAAATTDIVDHLPKQETPPRKEALPRKSASPSSGERKVVFAQTLAQCHPEEDNINVVITSVARPNQFHCQVFQESHTNLQELKLLTDSMKMDCEHSLSVANTKFEVGELCCAKFPEDGEWYRANVLEVFPDNTAKVLYVDYGNQCEVPVSELRPVRLEYTVLPRLAFTCSLHGVSPTGVSWSAEATTKLREFENRPLRARVTEVQGSVYELELEDVSGGGESVAKQLITAGLATPTKPAAESKEDKVDHLERQNQLLQQQINDMQAMMAQMMKK